MVCLYTIAYAAAAQAPVQRTIPWKAPRPIKHIKPVVQKDYTWYLAEIQRKYPDFAKKFNFSVGPNRTNNIRPAGFSKTQHAGSVYTAKDLMERLRQRYPQLTQQATMRRMSVQPRLTNEQVNAIHREQIRKRIEALQRGDLK